MTHVHVHSPAGVYKAQVRGYGCRRWRTVGEDFKAWREAMAFAVTSMERNDKRARVIFCADWYEPNLIIEAKL